MPGQNAFGNKAMSQAACFKWFAKLESGHESVEDEKRPDRPVTSTSRQNVNRICQTIENHYDRRQTKRHVATATNLSFGFHVLRKTVGGRPRTAKFVPRLPSVEQKQERIDMQRS